MACHKQFTTPFFKISRGVNICLQGASTCFHMFHTFNRRHVQTNKQSLTGPLKMNYYVPSPSTSLTIPINHILSYFSPTCCYEIPFLVLDVFSPTADLGTRNVHDQLGFSRGSIAFSPTKRFFLII